jgi:hypothetical protein
MMKDFADRIRVRLRLWRYLTTVSKDGQVG